MKKIKASREEIDQSIKEAFNMNNTSVKIYRAKS